MEKNFKHVYQLKISLVDITPAVWRRIHVPDTDTFSHLHLAIQRAMGWYNCHHYEFSTTLGVTLSENDLIRDIFPSSHHKKINYEYDFGNNWLHEIRLEKTLPANNQVLYPICIAGARACPPEDCEGVPGYYRLLHILKTPQHKDYDTMRKLYGENFQPEQFDLPALGVANEP